MTREEQIIEAGKTAAEGKEFSVLVNKQHRTMSAYEIGFIEGAEWADSHPHWIPVEERLPKVGEEVLIVAPSEDKPMKGWLQRNHIWWSKDYACHFENITHWMPLPEAPRKEE